jgi:antitoxin MazE
MQVSKWGNSLAVRLPAAIVKKLGWKEGDELDIEIGRNSIVEIVRVEARKPLSPEALFGLVRALPDKFPADFKFDRHEANQRHPVEGKKSGGIEDAAE